MGVVFGGAFSIQISSKTTAENLVRRHLGFVASDLDRADPDFFGCQCPTKWGQCLNELNITPWCLR